MQPALKLENQVKELEKDFVTESCNSIKPWLIDVRRELHRIPELALEENLTKQKVISYLKEIGIDYMEFTKHNGIMAYILKENADKTICIRADMDALPIEEENDIPYKSIHNGKMHACGHDAHTTMLLGACKVLYSMKDSLNVNVKFLFQPAEEGFGGAKFLVEDGCLENPKADYIFGLHVMPHIETGFIETKYDTLNASVDTIEISVKGKRAHGAYPENGIDAIVTASQIVTSLQTIISRNLEPNNAAVLTIGKIYGGDAHNVICEDVKLEGTLRTLNSETRDFVINKITKIVEDTASAFGCIGTLHVSDENYPAVINEKELVDTVISSTKELLGEEKFIMRANPSLGGEDFSFYTEHCKGAFFHLGCKNEEKGLVSPLHTSKFNVDEDCLPIGVMMHVMNTLYFN
ncbi:M20 metallopeptidase family protein [Clostridioides difficile]